MEKVVCICGSGLGSSFLVEMNVKTVLKDLGLSEIEVEHTDLGSAWPGIADLIVCGNDLYDNLKKFGDTIGLANIMDKDELKEKLSVYLTAKGVL
ncbi:Ascorbate-specific phosphotransferase enzyme IIB component [Candidatus Izimaplasma bacterium HR1]|jgi:PTS system ascorbate-specific IIB component|uniref:PTS sugar transporter subunit IIB n=1 Tax=Candidatus Izimoplasma sp. HR1 TaxID=1541959 RepID=UPI0004F87E03|nr:Ascorbate-specific phosphotransferase enzyme IIB component [Candidatus Izimaplasma bacterium HR1]